MSDSDKVVDFGDAKHRKDHERKERKVDQMRERFSKALGEDKPQPKGGLWNWKNKRKNKPKKPTL